MGRYIMESTGEGRRLEEKTDPESVSQQLRAAGLQPGMRVLDAGGGTGAVARVIAELVGPAGEVVVIDRSPERLQEGERLARRAELGNVRFVCEEIGADPPAEREFDFVWCRFVFEYLAAPIDALDALCRRARVGGKVVVGDLDGNGVVQHPPDPVVEAGIRKMVAVLGDGFDPFMGRKLVHFYHRVGLRLDAVHIFPYHVYAGAMPESDRRNWSQKFAVLAPACASAFKAAGEYERFVARFFEHVCSPGTFMYSTLIIAEGTRVQ